MSRKRTSIPSNQLRRYRRKRRLRQRDIAKLLGLSDAVHVADWEKCRRLPSLTNALKLSSAIGCPIEILFSNQFREIRTRMHTTRIESGIKLEYK